MHEERENFKFTTDFDDRKSVDPESFTPEAIATHNEEQATLQERNLTRAADILTPNQLVKFESNQKRMNSMREMGMKMAVTMFGNKTESNK
jgi:hypothetical protein